MQLAGFKTLDELKKEVQDGIFDSWELDDVVGTLDDMKLLLAELRKTNIYLSWGVVNYSFGYWLKKYPVIVLQVGGLNHKGITVWGYDCGQDLYFACNIDEHGNIKERKDEIYLDMVLQSLDELIERPADWTDEEYRQRAEADSKAKGVNIDLLNKIF